MIVFIASSLQSVKLYFCCIYLKYIFFTRIYIFNDLAKCYKNGKVLSYKSYSVHFQYNIQIGKFFIFREANAHNEKIILKCCI